MISVKTPFNLIASKSQCFIDLNPPESWRLIQRKNFTNLKNLADFLALNFEQRKQLLDKPNFAINVPYRLAQKMTKGSLEDPLVKQFLPFKSEFENHDLFVQDPVGDEQCRRTAQLLHKYRGRVLLVCTSACAMHCRYCFRQNFSYQSHDKTFLKELDLIRQDSSIHEIILSGGDPLSLSNNILAKLFEELNGISHLKRIRFHTRFPIGIPERIDKGFLNIIENCPKQIFFVIHCNHPLELDEDIFERLKVLHLKGCVLLNQSVLLKGVNDRIEVLEELCELLSDHGIIPYYLHQLDRVKGASHFELEEKEGAALIQELSKRLSGYAIPRYVREIAGEAHKTPIQLLF
ncbi:KamA family radical SAM protein [Candidatus Protochlamydia amoebophila]|uniref:KamA family radical SAM protein n=1 Tax=Candidatus Protochlamydia amoebophila TaxID=362787 RepID=UPI001BC8D76B|nr:KamA family radical SAM protein [Candidatus Protochlamydia amoebophila]